MYKILGFNKFMSKAGKLFCTIQLAREFTDYEKQNGAIGFRTVTRRDGSDFFLPDSLIGIAVPENIGKMCNVYFTASGSVADVIVSK